VLASAFGMASVIGAFDKIDNFMGETTSAFWGDGSTPFLLKPGVTRRQLAVMFAKCDVNTAFRMPSSPSHAKFLGRRLRMRGCRFKLIFQPLAFNPYVKRKWHEKTGLEREPTLHELWDMIYVVVSADFARDSKFKRLRGRKAPVIGALRYLKNLFGRSGRFIQLNEHYTTRVNGFTELYEDFFVVRAHGQSHNARVYRRDAGAPLAARGTRVGEFKRQHYRLLQRDIHSSLTQCGIALTLACGLPRPDAYCFDRELVWRRMYIAANYDVAALAPQIEQQALAAGRKLPSAADVARAIYGVTPAD